MSVKGSCHCGYLQMVVEQDDLTDVANCHCSICRRSTGGTFVTWATVPKDCLKWVGGTPAVYRATENSQRFYCPRCGAQMALYTDLAPQTVDVTVSTLDRVDEFPPTREIWVKNKIKWVKLSKSLVHEDEEVL